MNQRFASACGPRRPSKRTRGDEVATEPMDIDHQHTTTVLAASGITRSCMRTRFGPWRVGWKRPIEDVVKSERLAVRLRHKLTHASQTDSETGDI